MTSIPLVVEVADDVPRLLGDPSPVRMGGHPSDPNPSATELDEEQDIELLEHESVDGEEVGGHDMRRLGLQKRPPRGTRPPWGGPQAVVLQDPGNRARRQSDAELDQLSLDAAVAPPRVSPWPDGPRERWSPRRSIEAELPVSPTCPVVVCFRPEANDEAGTAFGFNYRVLDPHGAVIDARRTGIEWNRGTAPQVVEPERYYKTLEVEIPVREGGQYAVELWLDGGEPIRLPYLFSAWSL